MRKLSLWSVLAAFLTIAAGCSSWEVKPSDSDLVFSDLATVWDEAMPLGNAVVGELVWQKEDNLRFSLDRIDLWDLRPIDAFQSEEFSFDWVKDHVRRGDYAPVVDLFETKSYSPAPSKIPGAALEVDISSWGPVKENRLFLNNALCEVTWENGTALKTFVQADWKEMGYESFLVVDPNLYISRSYWLWIRASGTRTTDFSQYGCQYAICRLNAFEEPSDRALETSPQAFSPEREEVTLQTAITLSDWRFHSTATSYKKSPQPH